jgi:hypothetical protein
MKFQDIETVYQWVEQLICDTKAIQESSEWKEIKKNGGIYTPVDFSNVLSALMHIKDGIKGVQESEEGKKLEDIFLEFGSDFDTEIKNSEVSDLANS